MRKYDEGVDAWNLWRTHSPHVEPDLSGSDLREHPDRSGINLAGAQLEYANLASVILTNADLSHSKLTNATLVDVDFRESDMRGADLTSATVGGARYDRQMRCLGARVDLCTGNPRFVRHVLEADYIEAFGLEHPLLSKVWGLTSSYSRSFLRVAFIAVGLVVFFAAIYYALPKMLNWPATMAHQTAGLPHWIGEPLYYSASIFTTLGAGNIYPRDTLGQIATTVEVTIGYIWLGYLISILAHRATVRS